MSWDFSGDGANQQFGWRQRNGGEWHYGRDYGTKGKTKVPLGVPKYCDGWICHIIENNKVDGLGNQVVLISPDGKELVRFGHIETGTMNHLKTGQILNHGDWIGNISGVGYTETSFQPHIHVEHGFNPKYELVQIEHNKKQYRIYQWFCGEHTIQDYKDPQEGALPFEELEELTDLAFQSREAVLSGKKRNVNMSDVLPCDLVKKSEESESSFSSWFKSTWIGSLFYSDDEKKEEESLKEPTKREGPVIHRKSPVLNESSFNNHNNRANGVLNVLEQNAGNRETLIENPTVVLSQNKSERG